MNDIDIDRRTRRTKQILKDHFIYLVMEHGYKNVSVKDIVDRADYNRSTFYHYYKDKEDLADELVTEMLGKMEESFQRPFNSKTDVEVTTLTPKNLALFEHIFENKEFYSLLKISDTLPQLHEKIIYKILALYGTLTFKSKSKDPMSKDHLNTFITYGEYGLILEWIKDNYGKPPTQLAEEIIDIFASHVYSVRLKE